MLDAKGNWGRRSAVGLPGQLPTPKRSPQFGVDSFSPAPHSQAPSAVGVEDHPPPSVLFESGRAAENSAVARGAAMRATGDPAALPPSQTGGTAAKRRRLTLDDDAQLRALCEGMGIDGGVSAAGTAGTSTDGRDGRTAEVEPPPPPPRPSGSYEYQDLFAAGGGGVGGFAGASRTAAAASSKKAVTGTAAVIQGPRVPGPRHEAGNAALTVPRGNAASNSSLLNKCKQNAASSSHAASSSSQLGGAARPPIHAAFGAGGAGLPAFGAGDAVDSARIRSLRARGRPVLGVHDNCVTSCEKRGLNLPKTIADLRWEALKEAWARVGFLKKFWMDGKGRCGDDEGKGRGWRFLVRRFPDPHRGAGETVFSFDEN